MRVSLPEREVEITNQIVSKNWYDYFDDVYKKIIGYFNGTLTSTVYKNTEQKGNSGGTETSISNFLIRQKRLDDKTIIDLFIGGTRVPNANNKTIRLKLNALTIYTDTVTTSGGSWQVRVKIINLRDTQKIFIDNGGTSTYTTTSIDTNSTDIDIILTLQGVASDDIVKEYFEVKYSS